MKQDVLLYLTGKLGIDHGDAKDLYRSFMDTFGEWLGTLKNAAPDDYEEIRRISHAFIGFSASVGANDLMLLSERLNASAKNKDSVSVRMAALMIENLHGQYLLERQ